MNLPKQFKFYHKDEQDLIYDAFFQREKYIISWGKGHWGGPGNTNFNIEEVKRNIQEKHWILLEYKNNEEAAMLLMREE